MKQIFNNKDFEVFVEKGRRIYLEFHLLACMDFVKTDVNNHMMVLQ